MAATAEALVRDGRPARPNLRVVDGAGGRADARRIAARRRLIVLAVVAVAAFVLGLAAASGPGRDGLGDSAGGSAAAQGAEATVVVGPGDTVWDLAREHLPEGVRAGDYVREVLEANAIDPTALQPGTVVRLPSP